MEAVALVGQANPSGSTDIVASLLVPAMTPRPLPLYLSLRRLFGLFLVIVGGLIRTSAYRTLGRFFVGDIALQKDQKLVTTGPYAYVRHPSYTGVLILWLGNTIALTAPGSFLAAIDVWSSTLGAIVAFMMARSWMLATPALCIRILREDRFLRQTLGKEWQEWAERTPYRLVPYVW